MLIRRENEPPDTTRPTIAAQLLAFEIAADEIRQRMHQLNERIERELSAVGVTLTH